MNASDIAAWLSLAGTGTMAWFTYFRRGTVKMTQPSFIFFGPDGASFGGSAKVATCAHLYSTSDRGRIVEGLHVRLTANGVSNDFDVWVYGSEGLARGSGVYVGRDGVTCSHHFLLPRADEDFDFVAGKYTVEFFGKIVGDKSIRRLFVVNLALTGEAATAIRDGGAGVFFEWRPAKQVYESRIDSAKDREERQMRSLPAIFSALAGGRDDRQAG
jgi:hypothetical protein